MINCNLNLSKTDDGGKTLKKAKYVDSEVKNALDLLTIKSTKLEK